MSNNKTWKDYELCHFYGTFWNLSRHNRHFLDVEYRVTTMLLFFQHCGGDEMHLDVCARRLLYHRVSMQSALSDREDAHLLGLLCWMYRSEVQMTSPHWEKKMLALWSGIQGASYGKKAQWCLVWLQLSIDVLDFFSGLCTRWSQGYAFTSCFIRRLKFDFMAFLKAEL